jgi:hypothetical protein
MRATPPINVTSAKLTSSTVAEPFVATAYSAGTTYAFGAIASVAADYAIYESLMSGNLGNTPATSPLFWRKIGATETAFDPGKTNYALGETCSANHRVYESLASQVAANPLPVLPETKTAFWLDVGPTLRYAMFDLSRNTQSVCASPFTVVVAPGQRINTIGLTGMVGNTLVIKATSVAAGGTIYPLAHNAARTYNKGDCVTVGLATCYQSKIDGNSYAPPNAAYWDVVVGAVFDLNTRDVFDAYTYCFAPFATKPTKAVFDVPPVSDVVITATLTAASGNCKIGGMTIGTNIYLGKLLKPAKNVGKSFSSVTRDLYGNATLVKRKMLPRLEGTLLLESRYINLAIAARSLLDAEPALYTGIDEDGDWTDAVTILGVHQQFDFESTEGLEARVSFSAEEI